MNMEIDLINENNIILENRSRSGLTLTELLSLNATIFANNIAISSLIEKITYQELEFLVNKTANYIRHNANKLNLKITANSKIAVAIEASIDAVISILAILKLGAAYVPVDIAAPSSRINFICENAEVLFVIIGPNDECVFEKAICILDRETMLSSDFSGEFKTPEYHPENLAYIIYTSGSTGVPKGVKITHKNVVRLIDVTAHLFTDNHPNKWSLFHSLAFDFSVWELFFPLLTGGEVNIIPASYKTNFRQLLSHLIQEQISCLNITPSVFQALQEYSVSNHIFFPSLKYIIFGGENINLEVISRWYEHHGEAPMLINMFGATELTIHMSYCQMSREMINAMRYSPIGKPLADLKAYVLDEELKPVADFEHGVMYVSGPGVAKGYQNNQDQTDQVFLVNPYNNSGDEEHNIIYKTGDIVYKDLSDQLFYVRRDDNQIKIRGFRVELNEIILALQKHPKIKNAYASLEEINHEKQITAYILSGEMTSYHEIFDYLLLHLPLYMLPQRIYKVEEFKTNQNGKLDVNKLKRCAILLPHNSDISEQISPLQTILIKLWQKELGIENFSIADHFMTLGGTSLNALCLIASINDQFGLNISFNEIIKYPTLEKFSTYIENLPKSQVKLDKQISDNDFQLSKRQKALIYLQGIISKDLPIYNVFSIINIQGNLDLDRLYLAIKGAVAAFPILSTYLPNPDSEILMALPNPVICNLHLNVENYVEKIKLLIETPINTQVMTQIDLLQIERELHILVVNVNHLIFDGWSMKILLNKISRNYRGDRDSFAITNNVKKLSDIEPQLEEWNRYLDGIENVNFTIYKDPPRNFLYTGNVYTKKIGKIQTNQIREFCKANKITIFNFLITVYAMLLHKYSQKNRYCIGIPVSLRNNASVLQRINYDVNTLPVKYDITQHTSFNCALDNTLSSLNFIYDHLETSLTDITTLIVHDNANKDHPVFQVMFNENYNYVDDFKIQGCDIEFLRYSNGTTKFLQSLNYVMDENIVFELEYSTQYFSEIGINEFMDHYVSLIETCMADPGRKSKDIKFWTADGGNSKLNYQNNVSLKSHSNLVQNFLAQVSKSPTAIALYHNASSMTFSELDRLSHTIATNLVTHCKYSSRIIVIDLVQSFEFIACVLAVLKCGCSYVPLSKSDPILRKLQIIKDADPEVIISNEPDILVSYVNVPVLEITDLKNSAMRLGVLPQLDFLANSPCQILYTSGSTGKPKGVVISHSAILNMIDQHNFNLLATDKIAQIGNLAFNASNFEIWNTLINGVPLVICEKSILLDHAEFKKFLITNNISVLLITTALLQAYIDIDPLIFSSLRYLLFGGEKCNPALIKKLYLSLKDSSCKLIQLYGSTELSCFSHAHVITDDTLKLEQVPIGQPARGVYQYILDPQLNMIPNGVIGELYIGGDSLALGYHKNDILQNEKFINDIFSSGSQRLYKTGDLAKYNQNRDVEYFIRVDDVIKNRGFFVELIEIETCVKMHVDVQSCWAKQLEIQNQKKLILIVIPQSKTVDKNLFCQEMRRYLEVRLPQFMQPDDILIFDAIPITRNGKVDVNAIEKIVTDLVIHEENNGESIIHDELINIWRELINAKSISYDANFFNSGGNSILAIKLASTISQHFDINFSVRDVFLNPELFSQESEIHRKMRQSQFKKNMPLPQPRVHQNYFNTSKIQQQIWLACQAHGEKSLFNIMIEYDLWGELNLNILQTAWNAILHDHDILRSSYCFKEGQLTMLINPYQIYQLNIHECVESETSSCDISKIIFKLSNQNFSLENYPLFNLDVIKINHHYHKLILVAHHIIMDGVAIAQLLRKLSQLYSALLSGDPQILLRKDAYDYRSFIDWENQIFNTDIYQSGLEYWKDQLSNYHGEIKLPFSKSFKKENNCGDVFKVKIPQDLSTALDNYCYFNKVTAANALLSILFVLISRYTHENDLVIGITAENRVSPEFKDVIGDFANVLPIRCKLDFNAKIDHLHNQLTHLLAGAIDYQFIPFSEILRLSGLVSNPHSSPLVQILFSYYDFEGDTLFFDNMKYRRIQNFSKTSKYDLSFIILKNGHELSLNIEYLDCRYNVESIEIISKHFLNLMRQTTSNDIHVEDISHYKFLTHAEEIYHDHLRSGIQRPSNSFLPVCRVFEQIVSEYPRQIAVIDTEYYSYEMLNRFSNQIANYLVENDFHNQKLIAFYMERSFFSVALTLAILKVRSIFLPLSVHLPINAIDHILEDSRVDLVITLTQHQMFFSGIKKELLVLDNQITLEEMNTLKSENMHIQVNAEDLAYVIYTSGTTGAPKGIAIKQDSLTNSILAIGNKLNLNSSDNVLALSTLSFDLSLFDYFVPLCFGAKVVIADDNIKRDPYELLKIIAHHNITCAAATPDLWRNLSLAGLKNSSTFKIINAGEAITADVVEKLLEKGIIYNFYGPTETTIFASCAIITHADDIHLGKPLGNYAFLILNEQLQPQCCDIPGILYIGGIGLAEGYYNNEALTQEKFIYLEINKEKIRVYKTNDIVILTQSGLIKYVGRADSQVKYHGHRIELSGIEAVLNRNASIEKSVVVLSNPFDGTARLIAYYIEKNSGLSSHQIRAYLSEYLPSYMIPSHYIKVENFPLNANGKIDKQRLLNIEQDPNFIGENLNIYENVVEERIAQLWQDLLKVPNIHSDADFFSLGGNSILLIQFLMQLKHQFAIDIPAYKLFEKPTISSIARLIGNQPLQQNLFIVHDAEKEFEEFPLSEIQRAYWLGRLGAFEIGNVATHLYVEFDFKNISHEKLQVTFNLLIQRHSMLRCILTKNFMQKILEKVNKYVIAIHDFSGLTKVKQLSSLKKIQEDLSHHVYDLYEWPLFNIVLSKCQDFYRLHISLDGIITDAQSFILLLNDWNRLYLDFPQTLRGLALNYRDYILTYQKLLTTRQASGDKTYWMNKLNDLPTRIELPLMAKPESISHPRFRRVKNVVNENDFNKLKQFCAAHHLEVSAVLLASFSMLLNYWSDKDNFLIKLTTLNRFFGHSDIDKVFGDFTTLTLFEVYSDNIKNHTIKNYFLTVQKLLLENLSHNLYGAISIERDLIMKHKLDTRASLAPVIFSCFLLEYGIPKDQLFDNKIINTFSISQTSQVWLDTKIYTDAGELVLEWDYVEQLFDSNIVEFMNLLYAQLIKNISELDADKNCIDVLHNALRFLAPKSTLDSYSYSTHALNKYFSIDYQERIAVIDDERQLTYQQLHSLSGKLSTILLDQHNKFKADKIAILLPKGYKQVIAVLAVLNCNAAYVPLSIDWPAQRILDIITAYDINIVILNNTVLSKFVNQKVFNKIIVNLDELNLNEVSQFFTPLTKIDNPAYFIFTSGSTGKPKGVEVTHRQAMNTIFEINRRFNITSKDKILSLSALSFDLSVYDYFGALDRLATIVIPSESNYKNPDYLTQLIIDQCISVLNMVPMFLQLVVEFLESRQPPMILESVRLIMLSGDWIPVNLPDKLRIYFPNARIISLGGATEGGIWSIAYEVDETTSDWVSIPYGKALANQTVTIYNRDLLPVPYNFLGEIYLGGQSIASGYLNQPNETAERFIDHPYTHERIYKTGDVGFLRNDSNVILVGRNDFQIKIDGYRIELAEIEYALMSHSHVNACKIIAKKQDAKQVLIAFVMLRNGLNVEFENEFKLHLEQLLPKYMVPYFYQVVESFPLTSNGKLDTQKLLEMVEIKAAPVKMINSEDMAAMQRTLALHWSEILGLEINSNQQNFFHIGGNSLLALRLVYLLNDYYALNLPVSWVFQYETLREQAQQLKSIHFDLYWPVIKYSQSDAIPIVFIHPGNSGAEVYYPLAKMLPGDINFHVIDSYNLFSNEHMLASIEDVAEFYVSQLLKCSDSKTFILGGWSLGGTIAVAMANILHNLNYKVPALILLDSFNFNCDEQVQLVEYLPDILKNLQGSEVYQSMPLKHQETLLKVATIETQMLARYSTPKINSKIILLKAIKQQMINDAQKFQNFLNELLQKEDNGWSENSSQLEIIHIDSCHQTILQSSSLLMQISEVIKMSRSGLSPVAEVQ